MRLKLAYKLVFICFSLMAILAACSSPENNVSHTGTPASREIFSAAPLTNEEIIEFIGLETLPENAENVFMFGEAALDTMVILRLSLPDTEVSSFLANLGIDSPLQNNYSPFYASDAPYLEAEAWWNLPDFENYEGNYQGLRYQSETLKTYRMLIIASTMAYVDIYLQVYNQ